MHNPPRNGELDFLFFQWSCDHMRKLWLIICIFLLIPVYAQDLPLSETAELKTSDDHYSLEKIVTVYEKEGSTYTTENRAVSVMIAPQDYVEYQGQLLKEYFCDVLVSIVITTEDSETSQEFLSYLNFDSSQQSLIWDHAGYATADRAGETFGENSSLTVEDQYLEVTLTLTHLTLSEYTCGHCDTDAGSPIIFLDTLRLRVDITYTSSQKDTIEQMQEDMEKYGDAQEYVTAAQQYFQQGEFDKARDEFQKAKDVFDQINDTEKSDEMQEQIDKCISYDAATENLRDGMNTFEEASRTNDYQEATNKFEEARSYFQKAQAEFDKAEDTSKSDECETWIDRCDDEIDNLKGVGSLREKLIYIVLAIAVIAGAGIIMKQLGKGKPPKQAKGITLTVVNAVTREETTLQVEQSDRIGKVRQAAGTQLGIVPSGLLYNGKECRPDWTVKECGLHTGAVVEVVPGGTEPAGVQAKIEVGDKKERLEKLQQMYKEGKIPKELYESLKRQLERE
jgi:tetratricopeptide (TPR) repeat protein